MVMLSSAPGRTVSRAVADTDSSQRGQIIIRVFDIAIAVAALAFLLPLLLLVVIALSMEQGPIIFAHERVGLGGRRFRCLKFRTMVVNAEQQLIRVLRDNPQARLEWSRNQKLQRDPRVTPLGDFLRKSSLDELPQLINVLRGDMSIVGPRPIVEAEICRYGHRFWHYCSVKPGITGLWQISGRNETSYRKRVAMDSLYVKSLRPGLYIWITVATVPAVLLRRGSY